MNVENYIELLASFIQFVCLCIGEVFPKPRVEACFHEIKMAANSQEYAIHGFDIQTYLGIFISKFEEMR